MTLYRKAFVYVPLLMSFSLVFACLPTTLSATVINYDNLSAWQAAVAKAPSSYNFAGFSGNDSTANGASVDGVTFTGNLFSCGGIFPSSCSGPGGYLIGYETITDILPANTFGAAGDFGTYYGNTPQTLSIVATTAGGVTNTVTVNPGNGSIFEGFISTNPTDALVSVSATEIGSNRNYSAQFDGFVSVGAPTPEPGTMALLVGGVALIALKRARAARSL